MPLFKGISSKSTPDKAIRYITDPKKAAVVSVRNLFEDEDYAKQFKETANLFGKGKKHDERKYYHFKLSCAQKDKVTAEEAQIYATELTTRLFKDCECVIATHTDTKTIHSHIIVNAVNPITGKKLRITKNDYVAMKDEANSLGKEFGFTPTNFRKKAENKRTSQENHIVLKGGNSWKEDLREVIAEAKLKAATNEEFVKHLLLYNVKITRSKTEYSFLHPQQQKPIRGKRLGENYSKEIIENVINKNRHGRSIQTVAGIDGACNLTEGTSGQRPIERSVSDIQREMQRLNQRAERAHQGIWTENVVDRPENGIIGDESEVQNIRGNQSNGSGNPATKPNKNGDKASGKKRDYDYGK